MEYDKIFSNHISYKGLMSKIYIMYSAIIKSQIIQLKLVKDQNRYFSKEDTQMAMNTWKYAQYHWSFVVFVI